METYIIIIALAIVVTVLVGAYCVTKNLDEFNNKIYIYPKTENRYLVLGECKLKCPSSGVWYEAILYQSVNDSSKLYVREKKDFFDKFVKLND